MADFKPEWNIFRFNKLALRGKPWDASNPKEAPSLKFGLHELNPRFFLYTNKAGAKKGSITIKLDPLIAASMFTAIRRLANDKTIPNLVLDIKSMYDHARGGKQERPVTIAKMIVGRNGEGQMYIAFSSPEIGQQPATFVFESSPWAVMKTDTDEDYPKDTASEMLAIGFADTFEDLMKSYMVVKGIEPKPPQGGYGGGGNQSGGGNSGGGNSSFNDSIPNNW